MATSIKSNKTKPVTGEPGVYATIEEASMAKHGHLIELFKRLNVKVVRKN